LLESISGEVELLGVMLFRHFTGLPGVRKGS